MSTLAQPDLGVAKKPPLPAGLLVATILVTAQTVVRAYFQISLLVNVPRAILNNPEFLILSIIIPIVLLIATIVMIVLIFARLPGAKAYGITVCSLNILFQLYTIVIRLMRLGLTANLLTGYAINLVYIAIFAAAFVFLLTWTASTPAESYDTAPTTGTSYRGMAQGSLICAICGPLFLVILGPTALILGVVARKKMRASGNPDGQGMALAGIIIGSIETVFMVLALLLAFAVRF